MIEEKAILRRRWITYLKPGEVQQNCHCPGPFQKGTSVTKCGICNFDIERDDANLSK